MNHRGHTPKVSDSAPFLLQKARPQLIVSTSPITTTCEHPTTCLIPDRLAAGPWPHRPPPPRKAPEPPDAVSSETDASHLFGGDLLLALQGVCLQLEFLLPSWEKICFDVEAGLLFLSLRVTPFLWALLSVEIWQAGSSLSSAFPPGGAFMQTLTRVSPQSHAACLFLLPSRPGFFLLQCSRLRSFECEGHPFGSRVDDGRRTFTL